MYSLGDGVEKNVAEAELWKQKAAAQGHIGCKRKQRR
jgi:TPR repeat protein